MTARRRSPSRKQRAQQRFTRRLRSAEKLEHRVLLAGDAVSAFQNLDDPYDVDASGNVTPADAFAMIRHLNMNGFSMAAGAEGEPNADSFFPDVNGDGQFSPSDIMSELRYLNGAEGEGDATMQYRVEVTDQAGNPVTTATVGDQLQLRGYIQDIRDEEVASGLFAAYVDVEYDASLISVPSSGAISFTADFPEGATGDTSVPGIIDEVGAFRSAFSGLGSVESLLFTVDLQASAPGTVSFTTNVADDLPNSESAFYAPTTAIPEDEMMFGSIVLTIAEAEPLTATEDAFDVMEDDPATSLDVLANDGFPAGTTISDLSTALTTGSVEISNDGESVLYTPAPDFFGVDAFDYFVTTTEGTFIGRATITVMGTDDPPMANDDVYPDDWESDDPRLGSLREDATEAVVLDVLSNDTNLPDDINQEIWTITNVSSGAAGTVTSNSLNILYTPAPDFFGADTFTYTITGFSSGASGTGTVTVNIAEVNDDPIVDGETVTANEDATEVFLASDLLANDVPGPPNESGQSLRIVNVIYTGDGLAEVTADGNISYTPAAGFIGEDTLMYVVEDDGTTDGVAAPKTAIAALTINVGEATTLTDDAFSVLFASADNELDVLANDGLTGATITDVQDPANGTASVNGDGTRILYSPAGGFLGDDIFTYTVEDAGGQQLTGTITVTVEAAPPMAVDDALPVGLNGGSLNVLVNDQIGAGGSSLRVDSVTQPANGTASVVINGVGVTYQPTAGFTGVDTFTYTVVDNFGNTSTANVEVTVEDDTNENEDPRAFDDDFDLVSDVVDQELDVLANDTTLPDENETLTIDMVIVTPLNGTASINAAGDRILYTPNAGYAGTDSFIYQINDGNGGTDTALVQLNVIGDNTGPPTAVDDTFTVTKNLPGTIDVLANDSGDGTLTIDGFTVTPVNGTATVNAAGDRIVYTPDVDFVGTDNFIYRVLDGDGESATAMVTVTVEDDSIEIPAEAMADSFTVMQNGAGNFDVLLNDLGDAPLEITAITVVASNGTATINAEGDRILYSPATDFVGSDSFSYEITDANGETATVQVTVTVEEDSTNIPAEAMADSFTVMQNGAGNFDVLLNDMGDAPLEITAITVVASDGTATINAEGDRILYSPATDFVGSDSFSYEITDANGETATAQVTVTVEEDTMSNLPPVAEDDTFTFLDTDVRTLDVLANDSAEAGETLTITDVQAGSISGSVQISGDQLSVIYTPAANFTGTDSFTYTVDDGTGLTDTATVNVTIVDPTDVSEYAGAVFLDHNNNGVQDTGEAGLGGVTFVLEGTDAGGTPVRVETTSALSGAYQFGLITAGQYTVSQQQPTLTIDGLETSDGTTSDDDELDFTPGAGSGNGSGDFGERGLHPRYAAVEALASARGDGLLVVLQNGQQQWVHNRGGWDDLATVEVSLSGGLVSIVATDADGVESVSNLSLASRGVQLLSQSATGETMLRISGSANAVLTASAIDAFFAS